MTIPKRYELTDEQWNRIEPMFPAYRTGRPATIDNRTAFNGILWLMRSGAAWRDIPERYGHWKAIYSRFQRWSNSGLFLKMFEELSQDPDMENISLDSTSIRVHQKATGAKKTPSMQSSTNS